MLNKVRPPIRRVLAATCTANHFLCYTKCARFSINHCSEEDSATSTHVSTQARVPSPDNQLRPLYGQAARVEMQPPDHNMASIIQSICTAPEIVTQHPISIMTHLARQLGLAPIC